MNSKGKYLLWAAFLLVGVFLVVGLSVYPLHYSFTDSVLFIGLMGCFALVEFVLDDASI